MRIVPRLAFIILISALISPAQAFVVGQSCGQLFDQTGDVIAYIADLSQNQKLSVEQLARLYEALKSEDKFTNPYTEQDAIAADVFIHWQKFEELVRDSVIDKKKLAKWLEEKVKEKVRVKGEREQTKQETQDSHVKIKFNHIKRGSFMMGEPGKQVLTIIDYDFEMMAYPLTQRQWALLTGENPSYFVDGPHTIEIKVNGKQIKIQTDNPVEQVSWNDTQIYIQMLNELSDKDDSLIYQIIPDHVKGAKYRLPTGAEWEYVARNAGKKHEKYSLDPKKLLDHGWFEENSNGSTHPVGERLRQVVDGHEFEMFGNVLEWVQDKGSRGNSDRVTRGCSWRAASYQAQPANSYNEWAQGYNNRIGFRLVRIRP